MAVAERLFPSFLGPAFHLDLPKINRAPRPWDFRWWRARLNPDHGQLNRPFTMPEQHQTNWCWAATGVALREFRSGQLMRQCEVAQAVRDPAAVDCCRRPSHRNCNAFEPISKVLDRLGLPYRPFSPPISPALVRSDINANCPIICTVVGGGTNHFVVIVAWYLSGGALWLKVDDPANGRRHSRLYSQFRQNYEGRVWRQTTRTLP